MKERTEKNRKQPFGYGVLEGVVCSIPAEAEMVQEIYRLYIKGMSIVQIAKVMTARGVPYRQGVPEWNKNMVARILDDSRYTGQLPYPAILEQKLFDQACKLRQKNRPRQLANQEIRWIRTKVSCAQCGARLIRKQTNAAAGRFGAVRVRHGDTTNAGQRAGPTGHKQIGCRCGFAGATEAARTQVSDHQAGTLLAARI